MLRSQRRRDHVHGLLKVRRPNPPCLLGDVVPFWLWEASSFRDPSVWSE